MTYHRHDKSWTERTGYGAQTGMPDDDVQAALRRSGFHHSRTSLGSMNIAGHWVGLAGTLAPIVIGELIEDPNKRWRATRLTAVATAVAYEAVHTVAELKRRREQDAKLSECRAGRSDR